MQAAWMLRSRQLRTEFAFWLALIGYHPQDRSAGQILYLVYAILFFSAWGLAVIGLLAGVMGQLLLIIQPLEPQAAAVNVMLLVLLAWLIYSLHQALRRSPLEFSEADAGLVCLTPIPREAIALTWYPGAWITSALPFGAIAVLIGFALIDIRFTQLDIFMFLEYLRSGLQALAVMLPLQAGLLAWIWSAGFFRLDPVRHPARQSWVAPVIAIGLLAAWIGGKETAWPVVSWFLAYPLAGAFRGEHFVLSLVLALALAGAGIMVMYRLASRVSLSKAAQETSGRDSLKAGVFLGNVDLVNQINTQRRLHGARMPARLPGIEGVWAIPWRQLVQMTRSIRLPEVAAWAGIFLAALAFFSLPDPGSRGWAMVGWALLSGQRAADRLRLDLSRWWLFRQAPQASRILILAELALPWLGIWLLTWLAWALLPARNSLEAWISFLAIPTASAAICLAAACDLLRQASVSRLLIESAPDLTALGVLGGLACIGAGLFAAAYAGKWLVAAVFPALISALVTASLAYLLWRIASGMLKNIG